MVLNVPTLKKALCCDEGVAVNDLGLGQVNLMACGPYMFCQSRCSHIPIMECPSVFTEAVLQGSARLSHIHLEALRTGGLVHHACALVHGDRVLGMD